MQRRSIRRRREDSGWDQRENEDATKCFLRNGSFSSQEKRVKNIFMHQKRSSLGTFSISWEVKSGQHCHTNVWFLQTVPPSGSWKCERDSSQQALQVSRGHASSAAPLNQKTITNQTSLIYYKHGSLHGDRFAYKDEYEKFKLYLTVLLLLLSLACYIFPNYRWATPPASTGVSMAITFWCSSSLQIPGCHPQLPAGVVLLHTNHQGEHPHHQRLQVSQSKPHNSSLR